MIRKHFTGQQPVYGRERGVKTCGGVTREKTEDAEEHRKWI